ncbi:MAG: hypothetical protein ACR2QO_16970 [Acidimicrobiales bacterium]
MRRTADFLKGVIALALILILLVGVPVALVTFAGNPIDDVRRILADELLSDDTTASLALRAGLTVLAWLAWAQIAFSILAEFLALARGRVAGNASLLPGVQDLARRLVVATTLLVNAFTSTTGATALLPLAVPAPVESVEVDLLRPPDLDLPYLVATADPQTAIYTATAGDTFWSLAESLLGDGLRWSEIREVNLGRTMPDGTVISEATEVIRSGWDLALPSDAVLPLTSAVVTVDAEVMPEQLELAERVDGVDPEMLGRWEVDNGDHFWAIAEETLTAAYGRPVTDEEITPYWNEIIETNRELLVTADPDLVHPGQTFDVVLPPLADEIVIGPTAVESPIDAEVISGDDVRQLGSPGDGNDDASDAGDGATAPGEAEWVSLEDTAGDGTLKPFEPAETDGGGPIDGSTVALGVFGSAIGAGALLELVRRRRAAAAIEQSSSSAVAAGPTGIAGFEARIRPVANTDAVRWLAATNRYLTHQLSSIPSNRPLPAVLAMRAGEFGIEVLLDEPSAAPAGFVTDGDTGAAWRVRADLDLDAIEAAGRGAPPYSPALLPVGETDAGDLLVDFEQLAVMSLVGDIGTIAGWLATVATSATAMSWSQSCSIVAIGVQTVLGGSNQVRVPTDVDRWADETIAEQTDLARNANTSTCRQRLEGGEAVFGGDEFDGPTIVLLGPGHDDLARRLMAVAELAYSSLVVITTTALDGHARIELQPNHGVAIPDESGLRLDFDPIVTGSATVRYAAELVGDGGDQQYADVFDTVRRRPLAPGDQFDEAFAAPEWPPPAPVERPPMNGFVAVTEAEPAPEEPPSTRPEVWPPPAPSPVDLRSPRLDVLEPRPVEARILTALPSIVGLGSSSAFAEELLVYLAVQRSATPIELGRMFLPDMAPEEHERLLADELGALDAAAGRDDEGRFRVWFDEPSDRYWVSGDIESDHHRFVSLVALADQSTTAADEQACLEAAMGLIDDEPGRAVGGGSYRWLDDDQPVRTALDTTVVSAAGRLGELALNGDRAEVARWAAAQGLVVVPGDEALRRVQMRAAAMLDDRQGVEDAYRAAVEVVEEAASWDGLQPETDALYRQLVDPLTERS